MRHTSRTSNAWDSRAPFARSPTCSVPGATGPSAQRRIAPPRRAPPRTGCNAPRSRVSQHERPRQVPIALDDGVRPAEIERFVGVERRMDAAEDDGRSAGSREHADLVAAQRIAGVYADSDDIAGLNRPHIEGVERFIGNL